MPPRYGGASGERDGGQPAEAGLARALLRSRGVDTLLRYRGRRCSRRGPGVSCARCFAAHPHLSRRAVSLAVCGAWRSSSNRTGSRDAICARLAPAAASRRTPGPAPAPVAHGRAVAAADQCARCARTRGFPLVTALATWARWKSVRSAGRRTKGSSTDCSRSTTTSGILGRSAST